MLVCDHAGQAIPQSLSGLGVAREELDRHIGWDIGAAEVTSLLSEALDAPAVLQTYSRLVIDCNRAPDHAGAFVAVSDGTAIPANAALSDAERALRIGEIYDPYHAAIGSLLAERTDTVLVAVHSFTPQMGGHARPWGLGILHQNNSPFSDRMLAVLRASSGYEVGDNEPYAMDGIDFTVPFHAGGQGLDYVELEIRQDLIAKPDGQAAMAALLAKALSEAL